MPGCVHRAGLDITNLIRLIWLEEMIKLAAIRMEGLTFIENVAEDALDDRDFFADGRFATDLLANVRCSREVIGMNMSVDNPLTCQPLVFDKGDQLISRLGFCAA